jgi:hypothetical protein
MECAHPVARRSYGSFAEYFTRRCYALVTKDAVALRHVKIQRTRFSSRSVPLHDVSERESSGTAHEEDVCLSIAAMLLERALGAGDSRWNGGQPRGADRLATRCTHAVVPLLDALQRAADLPHFPETHLIETICSPRRSIRCRADRAGRCVDQPLSRTEQYWCPIRHASRVRGTHGHYRHFVDYADAEGYRRRLMPLRHELQHKRSDLQPSRRSDRWRRPS